VTSTGPPGRPRPSTAVAVGDLPAATARAFGDRTAVVAGDTRLSYAQFAARVSRLAAALQALGCERGTPVAVLAHNCLAVLELHFAIPLAGATIVPLNTRFVSGEISACLADADCPIVFVSAELAARVEAAPGRTIIVLDERSGDRSAYEALIATAAPRPSSVAPAGVASIFFTSGSTGRPKGVELSHDNVVAGALSCALGVGLDASSGWLHASPMFHLADAWAIWATTLLGATHFIQRFEAQATLATLVDEPVTHTLLVPTALEMLAEAADAATGHVGPRPLAGLRAMLYGGAPIGAATYHRLVALGAPMVHTYGSTETSGCITVLRPEEHIRPDGTLRLGTVGREVPMTQVLIVDDAGAEVSPGEVGEIVVRSPNVMQGYHGAPELTAAALFDGAYRTGDLGRRDEDGFISLQGRKKEMLISGGENVYPNEIEQALAAHPALTDLAVGGLPDQRWGQVIAAVVVVRAGSSFDLAQCRAFLDEQLANYKIPKAVFVVAEIPRNGSGKIDRGRLEDVLVALAAQPSLT
jgi:acyl-CoA synthetase (AMP-forming)/AMP-acid ligase II